MRTDIIDTKTPGIVMSETPISLSDEKLKGLLLKTYEEAQRSANSFKYYDLYKVLLSVASTLLITLMTSTFSDLGNIKASAVTIIAQVIMILSAILGFVFLAIAFSEKTKKDTSDRDRVINEIFAKHGLDRK